MKEDRTRKAVLNNISNELRANKNDMERKMGYHRDMALKLNNYLSSDSLWQSLSYSSGIEAMSGILDKGILNPRFQDGAWRSAELSGIMNTFDYETIYILSNVYRVQEEGPDNTWRKLAEIFADPDSYEPGSARRIGKMFSLGFDELYSQEKSLINEYDKALNHLSKD